MSEVRAIRGTGGGRKRKRKPPRRHQRTWTLIMAGMCGAWTSAMLGLMFAQWFVPAIGAGVVAVLFGLIALRMDRGYRLW